MKGTCTRSNAGRNVAIVTVALALGGCSIFKPPNRPNVNTFMLEAPAFPSSQASDHANSAGETVETRVLRVAAMASSSVYNTPRMAYMRSADEIEYFATHRWADAPPEMLVPILVAGLERTDRFPALVGPSSRAAGDLVLETELLAFRQEFTESKPQFHAMIRASIMDLKRGVILGSPRTFDVVEPMEKAEPIAGVRAAELAAGRIADEIASYTVQTAQASQVIEGPQIIE